MRIAIITFVAGASLGGAFGYALAARGGGPRSVALPAPVAAGEAPALQVKRYRFDVTPGGGAELDE